MAETGRPLFEAGSWLLVAAGLLALPALAMPWHFDRVYRGDQHAGETVSVEEQHWFRVARSSGRAGTETATSYSPV